MKQRNQRPTVLITGAARRIGRSIACTMARAGWNVAIHYRNSAQDASELRDELHKLGAASVTLCADLSQYEAVAGLVPACCVELAPPCCLINNASSFQPDNLASLTDKLWDDHLAINLKAPVFLAQAMAKYLPDGANGNVINIIDQRVWRLTPDFFSYTISKAGLWTATRTLAQSLAPRIRVNAVGPGPILQSIHQTQADFSAEVDSTLLKLAPTPDDIARAVLFILETPAMTGQMIALDSGQHLTWSADARDM